MYKVKNPWLLILTNDCWISIRKNFFCDSILFNIIQIFFSDLYRPHRHHDIEVKHLNWKMNHQTRQTQIPRWTCIRTKDSAEASFKDEIHRAPRYKLVLTKSGNVQLQVILNLCQNYLPLLLVFSFTNFFLKKRAYFKSNGV